MASKTSVCALVSFLVLGVALAAAAQTDQELARADAEVLRLAPATFKDLPAAIRKYLDLRGCAIPQSYSNKNPHNIVRGRFVTPKEWDIAVLCSRERVSSVLVFRDGKTKTVDELATMSDAAFLVAVEGTGPLGFARVLGVAEPDSIKDRNGRYAGPKPKFDHEGIDDLILQNGSVVWYWVEGNWVRLRGSE